METSKTINAYILTGGSSRRFGLDKATSKINGTDFINLIYEKLQSNFKKIYSVGKKSYSKKIEFIPDFSFSQAAIVGIITALRHASSPWSFIISVDTPLITSDVVNALKNKIISGKNNLIIPIVHGKILPLTGFYHQNCIVYFEKAFSIENYTIKDVIPLLNPVIVNLSHYQMELTNVNTQKQLNQIKKIYT
jgi:molybdopterin-guanine dinucleotide biosynthesis protein A